MSKIPLTNATKSQMVAYASAHLGIELDPGATIAVLRTAIQTARVGITEIDIDFEGEPVPAPKRRPNGDDAVVSAREAGKTTVRVMIPANEEPGGDQPVPLGCNGVIMRVSRGVFVDLPMQYFEVLKNAEKVIREPMRDGSPGPERRVPAYPYSVDVRN